MTQEEVEDLQRQVDTDIIRMVALGMYSTSILDNQQLLKLVQSESLCYVFS